MIRGLLLFLGLFAIWFLWSGYLQGLLLFLGVLSSALVVHLMRRMKRLEGRSAIPELRLGVLGYWAWLLKEIVKANIAVARVILSRKLVISPTIIKVKALAETDVGRVTYANSVTLTPATVTMDVDGAMLTVHALTKESADDVLAGEMNRRVAALEPRRSAG